MEDKTIDKATTEVYDISIKPLDSGFRIYATFKGGKNSEEHAVSTLFDAIELIRNLIRDI